MDGFLLWLDEVIPPWINISAERESNLRAVRSTEGGAARRSGPTPLGQHEASVRLQTSVYCSALSSARPVESIALPRFETRNETHQTIGASLRGTPTSGSSSGGITERRRRARGDARRDGGNLEGGMFAVA